MPSVQLECPKCGRSFNYDYIPGASVTAIRLGGSRYMACPLCGKFSIFNLRGARLDGRPPRVGEPVYSDTRLLVRRLPWLLAPVVVGIAALLLATASGPTTVFWIEIACIVAFAFIAVALVILSRASPRTPTP